MTMTTTTGFSTSVRFAELRDDFLRLTAEIGWCTAATVDSRDRPRSRVLHVSWEVADDLPIGWVSTSKSPIKTAHLARNPYVSCSYWSAAHNAVFADCRASWVDDDAGKHHVWELVAAEAAERGFDAYDVWPEGYVDPQFQVLRLEPWRIQITLPDLANGKTISSSRVWHAAGSAAVTSV